MSPTSKNKVISTDTVVLFHFLTDRYADYTIENKNYTELSINEDGSITILGFPDENIKDFKFETTDY
jgi:hypothetical protein